MEHIHSVNMNADSNFPYLVLHTKNNMASPLTPGFRVFHWHEDLQFVYVRSGSATVELPGCMECLSGGEGAFINKNVVHRIVSLDECEYKSFIFPERLISFIGTPAVRMTQCICENPVISFVKMTEDNGWSDALCVLRELFDQGKTTELYCYEVLARLAALWLVVLRNIHQTEISAESGVSVRMRKMLQHIEKYFAESVTLDQIAQSAGISRSEALRCFKITLHTTPYRYLLDYRLSRAAALLKETSLPVGEIAFMTGFNQQTYFGKCFRERMDCTPGEYRRGNRE